MMRRAASLAPGDGTSGCLVSAAVTIALAVFMFLINVFSGLHHIWFHWPAAVFLLIAILWAVIRRKPS